MRDKFRHHRMNVFTLTGAMINHETNVLFLEKDKEQIGLEIVLINLIIIYKILLKQALLRLPIKFTCVSANVQQFRFKFYKNIRSGVLF